MVLEIWKIPFKRFAAHIHRCIVCCESVCRSVSVYVSESMLVSANECMGVYKRDGGGGGTYPHRQFLPTAWKQLNVIITECHFYHDESRFIFRTSPSVRQILLWGWVHICLCWEKALHFLWGNLLLQQCLLGHSHPRATRQLESKHSLFLVEHTQALSSSTMKGLIWSQETVKPGFKIDCFFILVV